MVFLAQERIYVNADRTQVVPGESPEAAYLLVGEGGELTDDEAARYGLAGQHGRVSAETRADGPEEQPEEDGDADTAPSRRSRRNE